MWCAWSGLELRLVQRGHEEWMVDPLDRTDLAGGIGGGNSHSMFIRNVLQGWREPVRACREFDDALSAVQLCKERPGRELNGDRLVLQRTFEQGDDRGPAPAILGVSGVSYSR